MGKRAPKGANKRRKPGEPPRTPEVVLEARRRVAACRDMLSGGTPIQVVLEWCMTATVLDEKRGIEEKPWAVNRTQARNYVNRALESIDSEDGQIEDRKRARNRALTTMIVQRLMRHGSVAALSAALRGADQLCKIDGSYDPSSVGPPNPFAPVTAEEATAMIEHASATLALARRRGVVPALEPGAKVIDVDSTEAETDDAPGVPAGAERPRDAN